MSCGFACKPTAAIVCVMPGAVGAARAPRGLSPKLVAPQTPIRASCVLRIVARFTAHSKGTDELRSYDQENERQCELPIGDITACESGKILSSHLGGSSAANKKAQAGARHALPMRCLIVSLPATRIEQERRDGYRRPELRWRSVQPIRGEMTDGAQQMTDLFQ